MSASAKTATAKVMQPTLCVRARARSHSSESALFCRLMVGRTRARAHARTHAREPLWPHLDFVRLSIRLRAKCTRDELRNTLISGAEAAARDARLCCKVRAPNYAALTGQMRASQPASQQELYGLCARARSQSITPSNELDVRDISYR